MPPLKIKILDSKIDDVSMSEAVLCVERLLHEGKPSYVVTPNVDHLVKLHKDPEFRQIYEGASLVLADGAPIIWASHFLGTPLKEKVSGSDLFPVLCEAAAHKNYKIFLLGGREGVAKKAAAALASKYPSLKIVGTYCPSMGFEKDGDLNRRIVEIIRAAKPDILFVGLGAPKQEKWIYRFLNDHCVPVSIGVGISFEFVAGTIKRAPKWTQTVGLEWLWRLLKEPTRLWRRYLLEDPIFFWLVFLQKISSEKSRR